MSEFGAFAQFEHPERYPHLTEYEWEALGRMANAVGNITVDLLLRNGDPEAQRLAAQEFMVVELTNARAQAHQTLARPSRVDPIKIITTKYSGDEKLPLRRWFCELDEAIEARQIVDTEQQVREKSQRELRFDAQSLDSLKASNNMAYQLVIEYQDIFPAEVPKALPPERGVRHEIDLVPGTKYSVTRQWPLPREQVEAFDKFFEARKIAGHNYFDDIFVHSKAEDGRSAEAVHLDHLRRVFDAMHNNKLYANLKNQKQLRQWLGLANYHHKYTKDYATLVQPLSQLLRKDVEWKWEDYHQTAFDAVKALIMLSAVR
ncbi:hypothetical protein ATCC90586_011372 [Pythium insidiosum]|nr:hypothetical protein ATCC90586_011372 [Pythium insidiosum]